MLNRQQGAIPIQALLYIGGALLVLGIGYKVVSTYNNAITEAQRLGTENSELRQVNNEQLAENNELRKEGQRKDKLLAVRQQVRVDQDALERKLDEIISKALQQPNVKEWANTPVPDAIIAGLRNESSNKSKPENREIDSTRKPANNTINP